MRKKNANAVTLRELLIIIVILAILATFVTPQYAEGASGSRLSPPRKWTWPLISIKRESESLP